MCLTSEYFKTRQEARDFKKNPLIAKKDIICYKLLRKSVYYRPVYWMTPYQNFEMEPGMHYYQEGRKFSGRVEDFFGDYYAEIEKGLHSWKTKKKAKTALSWNSGCKIFKCIIPKGSEYYIGRNDDYCSDNLIIGEKPLKH